MQNLALAIHGGAGTIDRSLMTPELEHEYTAGLREALDIGWKVLRSGGSAVEAVESAVVSLEDFHLFNAGRGSVFTHDGKIEMDASIMDGRGPDAGAVAFVRNIKNPIRLARLVMERTPHILLAGPGATDFAREMNVEFADDDYFFTEHRYQQLLRAREEGVVQLDHAPEEPILVELSDTSVNGSGKTSETNSADLFERNNRTKGTVGAVACDGAGHLAAATSTGGMTNKRFGRVGDTALIGSGTYADDGSCAVSCTGHGEYFMLAATSYDISARMKYERVGVEQAARESIERLTQMDGEGGLIAVDAHGNVTLPFNSPGMYRGWRTHDDPDGQIAIYR